MATAQTRYAVRHGLRSLRGQRSVPLCDRMPVSRMSPISAAGTMTVHHDQTSNLAAIEKKVMGLGYTVAPLAGRQHPRPPNIRAI